MTYVGDVKHICESDVINKEHPDVALDAFMKLLFFFFFFFLQFVDKHAPVKKLLELL